jgi:hypothetical protein
MYPVYSPTRVRIHNPTTDSINRLHQNTIIVADTINGVDSTLVTTNYRLSYCTGTDFYTCDLASSWIDFGSGVGGQTAQSLVAFPLTGLTWGASYTIRLTVTATNRTNGQTQSFNDFVSVMNWNGCNPNTFSTTPADSQAWNDTDGDGIGNPCDTNDDNDAYLDTIDPAPYDSAIPGTLPTSGLIWSDNFNRANENLTPNGYWSADTVMGTAPIVLSNVLEPQSGYSDLFAYWRLATNISAAYLNVDVKGTFDASNYVLIPRYGNSSAWYGCLFGDFDFDGSTELIILDAAFTTLAQASTPVAASSTAYVNFGCQMTSNNIVSGYINGSLITSTTISSPTISNGAIGIYNFGPSKTDNFQYYDVKP